jgi:transposase-like protein
VHSRPDIATRKGAQSRLPPTQVIDVFISPRRDATAAHRFIERAIGTTKVRLAEVVTDHAPVYPAVLEELLPLA